MYLVKVKIEVESTEEPQIEYKPIALEGMFIPKADSKRTQKKKIEEQCKAFLLKNLKNDNPELTFTFKSFDITKYKNHFTVAEDKE